MTASTTGRLTALLRRSVDRVARDRAALHLLDWIGCAAIGFTTEPGQAMARWVHGESARDSGGGRCTVVRHGCGSLWTALLANGAVGNIFEMDDIHRIAILHPGPVVVPAALAAAEHAGSDAPALLEAIVRGYEAMIRVGQALGPAHYRFWHNTATCGPFGAAAAAGALFGLTDAQQIDAFGNAGTQAAGLWQVRMEPGMGKQLHNGRAAHAGVLAADLARHGLTGARQILEGPLGFFAAMCPDGDVTKILDDPAGEWKLFDTGFKPWPACRHTHAAIDATLALRERVDVAAIESIEVRTFRDAVGICDRVHPTTTIEAKSGYGLNKEHELRMLEAMQREHRLEVIPTYLGAHAVPRRSHFGATGEVERLDQRLAGGNSDSPATLRRLSSDRAESATCAPAASSARAIAAPMPVEAPITHTRAWDHSGSGGLSGGSSRMVICPGGQRRVINI